MVRAVADTPVNLAAEVVPETVVIPVVAQAVAVETVHGAKIATIIVEVEAANAVTTVTKAETLKVAEANQASKSEATTN